MKKDYASSRIPWRGINRLQKMLLSMTFLLSALTVSAQFPNPYCTVSFPSGVEPITLVNFAGINNVSSATTGGTAHEDFTAIFANVEAGATYPISIQGNTDGSFTSKIVAFFDWNQDGDFLDAGESYNLPDIFGSTGLDAIVSAANIQIPAGALAGTTRMRIIKRFSTVPDACNASGFGQSEDYSVTVTIPTCPSVSGLTATTTQATATLSWVENGTATNWDIEYGPAGFAPTGTATVSVTATNTTITGLNASTSYQYYVRAFCSVSDQSTWTGPFNFTTTQIPAVIPFTDDFSTAQWSFVNGAQANKWYIGAAAGNPADGMYVSNDNGVTNAYTTNSSSVTQAYRDITFPAGTNPFGLKFDWKANGESTYDYLRVWVVPAGSVISAGTQITTTNAPGAFQIGTIFNQTSAWTMTQEYIIPASFAGTSARLVFEWRNDSGTGTQAPAAVDNVSMSVITCPAPTALTASAITDNTANLGWTQTGTSTNWDIEYGVAPHTFTGTTSVSVTTNPATISGLTPSTAYQYYVRSNCGGSDLSTWAGPFSFTTTQVPAVVPFTDDFSANQWALVNGTETNKWFVGTVAGNPGEGMYISNDNGVTNAYGNTTSTTQAYRDVAFPVGANTFNLNFDWKANGEGTADRLRVWLVPSSSTITAGTQITAGNTPGAVRIGAEFNLSTVWQTSQNFVIPETYAGTTARLVFEWRNNATTANQAPAAVDNVSITIISCPAPTALTASSLTDNSASLGWAQVGTSANWDIEYGVAPYTFTGTSTVSVTTNPATISGLAPSTTYQYYVRSNCGGSDQSTWAGPFSFTTTQIPAVLPFTDDFSTNEWTFVNGSQTNKWFIGAATGNPANGLYISNDNGVTNTYSTGSTSTTHAYRDIQFPAGTNTFNFSFDWKAVGEGFTTAFYDYFRVWIVPTSATLAAGTQISTGDIPAAVQLGANFNNSSVWVAGQSFVLPASYAGTNARLVFEWRNDSGSGTQAPAAIDNVQMSVITCSAPTAFTANNVTQTSIDLAWTENGSSSDWDIEYGPVGFTPTGAATLSVTANPTTISGLTANTTYSFYVRSACNLTLQSVWVGPLTVTTTQVPAVVPFTDDFSTNSWSFVNGTQVNKWFVGNAAGNPIDGMYVSNDNGVTNTYTTTTTSVTHAYRDVQFPASTNNFNLNFDWRAFGETSVDRIRVWMVPTSATITAGTQIATGTPVGALQLGGNLNQSTAWFSGQNLVIPASYAGTNARLVFEWINDGSVGTQNPAAIDNVMITEITCVSPTALVASNVTTTSVDLAWTENGSASSWDISYGVGSFNPNNGTIVSTSTNPTTVSGLQPSTSYRFYVRSNCSLTDSSTWFGPVTVITLCAPITALPWNESFDNMATVSGDLFPPCWVAETTFDWYTDNAATSTFNPGPLSPSNFLAADYDSDSKIWTPEFNLIAGQPYEFSFSWAGDGTSVWEGSVFVNSSQSSTGATALGSFVAPGQTTTLTYTKESYCFTPTVSGVYSFGVSAYDDGTSFFSNNLNFDDFSLIQSTVTPGNDGLLSVCQTALVDLNTVISNAPVGGTWNFNLNPNAVNNAGILNAASIPNGTYDFLYIVGGCAPDTTVAAITIVKPSSAGNDGAISVCRNQPFNLLSGLSGNADLGGVWTDPNASPVANGNATAANIPGQYNFKYIVSNGVCPADTAKVVVSVQGCNFLGLDEVAFEGFSMYPNPTSDIVYIANSGSTEVFNYEVLDMNGRIILKADQAINGTATTELNLSNVEIGVYMIRVFNENADKTFRVVKN